MNTLQMATAAEISSAPRQVISGPCPVTSALGERPAPSGLG